MQLVHIKVGIRRIAALAAMLAVGLVGGYAINANGDIPPAPPPDLGSGVFVTGSDQAFNDLSQMFCQVGQPRVAEFNSPPLVKRNIWPGFVLNVNKPSVLQALGNPKGAVTLVVDDPHAAATQLVNLAHAKGYHKARIVAGSVAGDDDRDLTFAVLPKRLLKVGLVVLRVHASRLHVGPVPVPQPQC